MGYFPHSIFAAVLISCLLITLIQLATSKFTAQEFDHVDANHDGVITQDELANWFLMEGHPPNIVAQLVQDVMHLQDLNHDGVLSRTEAMYVRPDPEMSNILGPHTASVDKDESNELLHTNEENQFETLVVRHHDRFERDQVRELDPLLTGSQRSKMNKKRIKGPKKDGLDPNQLHDDLRTHFNLDGEIAHTYHPTNHHPAFDSEDISSDDTILKKPIEHRYPIE